MKGKLTVLERLVIRIFNVFSPYRMRVLKYPESTETIKEATLASDGTWSTTIEKVGGFGCWYFQVGEDHPMYRTYRHQFSSEYDWDADWPDWYRYSAGSHETTYAEDGWIGFDLRHLWCRPEHDFWYLIKEAWQQVPDIRDTANK